MKKFLLIVTLMVSSTVFASDAIRVSSVNRVIDGDSIKVDVDGWPPVLGKDITIRIKDIDAPEIKRAKCVREKVQGNVAKTYLEVLLGEALVHNRDIKIVNIERGSFFRLVADLYIDEIKVADLMLEEGNAVSYEERDDKDWCKEPVDDVQENVQPEVT